MILVRRIREAVVSNYAPVSFAFFYFATVVLGNLAYASPWGAWLLGSAGYPTKFLCPRTSALSLIEHSARSWKLETGYWKMYQKMNSTLYVYGSTAAPSRAGS